MLLISSAQHQMTKSVSTQAYVYVYVYLPKIIGPEVPQLKWDWPKTNRF